MKEILVVIADDTDSETAVDQAIAPLGITITIVREGDLWLALLYRNMKTCDGRCRPYDLFCLVDLDDNVSAIDMISLAGRPRACFVNSYTLH